MSDDEREGSGHDDRSGSPLWERILGAIGGILLVAIVVLVLTGDDTPGVVTTEITTIRTTASTTVFDVDVVNEGGETVVDVLLVAELRDGAGGVIATSEATVAFLPGGGTEQVSLAFERRPEVDDLSVRVVGWTDA